VSGGTREMFVWMDELLLFRLKTFPLKNREDLELVEKRLEVSLLMDGQRLLRRPEPRIKSNKVEEMEVVDKIDGGLV
jgi:RNase P/RNase MRP subunit p29